MASLFRVAISCTNNWSRLVSLQFIASQSTQKNLPVFAVVGLHPAVVVSFLPTAAENGSIADDDYDYVVNGNLIKDQNKGIASISYDILNLPEQIVVANKGTISYTYDAAGTKLSKTVSETGQASKTTQYLGGMIFENNVLQHVATEEGRVRLESGQWRYDYFLKDHLGNVRVMLNDIATPLEETHYYPFGLTQRGISTQQSPIDCGCALNKKGFNGNEIQNKEFSDGSGLEVYDFNARIYGQQIGRFIQVDPLSEKENQEGLTPYHFSGNNPSTFNDPDGKCPWCWGALIGAAVEYGTQVAANIAQGKSLSTSLTDVDGTAIVISAGAGAISGGLSALAPKGAAAKLVLEGTKIGVDAVESSLKQYNETGTVSLKTTVADVVVNQIAGKVTENVAVNSSSTLKATERQLDRAQRIAKNDPSSSGRAANVKNLETKLGNQINANAAAQQAAGGAISNTLQGATNVILPRGNSKKPSLINYNNNRPVIDNTAVKKTIIPYL